LQGQAISGERTISLCSALERVRYFRFPSIPSLKNRAAGDIHIWDRDSATLLHHVRAQALGGDLTCIAWNHASSNPFMFATGSHEGAVKLWTTAPDCRTSPGGGPSTMGFTHSVSSLPVDNNGTRTYPSDAHMGEYTSEPLTLTPVEDSGPRDR